MTIETHGTPRAPSWRTVLIALCAVVLVFGIVAAAALRGAHVATAPKPVTIKQAAVETARSPAPQALPAATTEATIPDDILQACQNQYGGAGHDAVQACGRRLAEDRRYEEQAVRDELAKKDVQKIRDYGSVAAADRYHAVFGDEIGKCDRQVIHRWLSYKAYSRCIDKAEAKARDATGPGSSTLAPMR